MMASPELEEFTIALAASFQKLRLPPPPKRKAAPLTGKVNIGAVPGSYELARGPIKTAIHTHLAKTIHVLSKIANKMDSLGLPEIANKIDEILLEIK
jgi:hypothetical protein